MEKPMDEPAPRQSLYARTPMFVRILIGLAVGLILGWLIQNKVAGYRILGFHPYLDLNPAKLKPISNFVLGLLRLLATPLVFLAITLSLLRTNISGKSGVKLIWLILTNTLMAIFIGLLVVNVMQPGAGANLKADPAALAHKEAFDLNRDLLGKIMPTNFVDPFQANDILPLLVIALAAGIAMKRVMSHSPEHAAGVRQIERVLDALFQVVLTMLHWLFHLVPFAVCAVVAATVGEKGFAPFRAMGFFVIAVLLALCLQACWYQLRLRIGSWVRPPLFFRSGAEAFIMAFSTASSTATLPLTLECANHKLKLREENASMGVIVGGNLNNDGTALYEAMAALFVAQALGQHLPLSQQLVIVVMAVIASVGAAGIPEAGLVTMMAVFAAVKLPVENIPLLLTVDWFLDRCRTMINVMGDLTTASVLDGKVPGSLTSHVSGLTSPELAVT